MANGSNPPTFDELEDKEISALLAQDADDTTDFDIDVELEESEEEKTARRKRENEELRNSVSKGSFDSLRDDPDCMELPRGMPLGVFVPGAEITLPDDDAAIESLGEMLASHGRSGAPDR